MEPKFIETMIAPGFLIMGLSHLIQPYLWVRFFATMRNTGLAAVIISLYTLPIELVLIAGHNVWTWDWPIVLTIAGWGMTAKSAASLLVPGLAGLADRALAKKMASTPRSFQVIGAPMVVIGAILTWQAWMR